MQKTLLTFVDDVYEDLELWYPKLRLEEAGFGMRVAGPELIRCRMPPAAAPVSLWPETRLTASGLQ